MVFDLPRLTEISDEDREALERIEHDVLFYGERRGSLAVSVDLKDGERVLQLVARLAGAVKFQRGGR